jgi:hypothetical protein
LNVIVILRFSFGPFGAMYAFAVEGWVVADGECDGDVPPAFALDPVEREAVFAVVPATPADPAARAALSVDAAAVVVDPFAGARAVVT